MCLFWTQRKIFWRMRETEQYFVSYYGSQWCPKTAWLQTFFRISSFVFRTNTFIQVWSYLRMSKWQDFHFWVNYPFKSFYLSSNCILIPEFVDIYTWKQDTNAKEENFLQCSRWRYAPFKWVCQPALKGKDAQMCMLSHYNQHKKCVWTSSLVSIHLFWCAFWNSA